MSRLAKANYTQAKAATARAASSLEEWYNSAWEYSQGASEQFASWWKDLPEYSDVRASLETQARGNELVDIMLYYIAKSILQSLW